MNKSRFKIGVILRKAILASFVLLAIGYGLVHLPGVALRDVLLLLLASILVVLLFAIVGLVIGFFLQLHRQFKKKP